MATISNTDIARAIYLSSQDENNKSFYADVVQFLARKRLMSRSKDILSQLEKIINKEEGIVEVTVSSAGKLKEETKREINQFLEKRYKAREIILNESLDPKLLGGYRVEVNDEVLDMTYRNKITQLQEYLTR